MSYPEYPEDEDLEKIKEWDVLNDTSSLIDFVCSVWHWGEDMYKLKRFKNGRWKLELHTGDWSGNEEIIGALMQADVFWLLYWKKSERGGHYWFEGEHKTGGQEKNDE